VAKEYVAARRGLDGVLVLSEFTGASVELADAVLVNPYSAQLMDEAIDRALAMPEDEQRRRMQRMGASVEKYDATRWAHHMLESFRAL